VDVHLSANADFYGMQKFVLNNSIVHNEVITVGIGKNALRFATTGSTVTNIPILLSVEKVEATAMINVADYNSK